MAIRGLLFDKDGTLFHYDGTWAVWCGRVIERLSGGDVALGDRLGAVCGYDRATRRFVPGSVIVNGTAAQVVAIWAAELPDWRADEIDAIARELVHDLPNLPVCPLKPLFAGLRAQGFRLGIATNDYEAVAHDQLGREGVDGLFDFVAGYDSGHGVKPGPGMIHGFCEAMGLQPAQVAMIGDSTHDLGAGRAAGAGACIGVLTGPAREADIAHLADHVIADISGLPELLSQRQPA